MRFIRDLNPETRKLLERIARYSKYHQTRQRAECLILSYKKFSINQLICIFGVSRKTIYNWFTRWENEGLLGLYNNKGRGRKSKFTASQKEKIKQWVKEEPKALNKVLQKIEQKWNIKASKKTIKRIIKKLSMLWKRMKRGLSKSPDEWEVSIKLPELIELKNRYKKGEIDLRYFDESGFSLMPYVPYGWQEKNQQIIIKSSKSKRINVLGLMNINLELYYEIISGNVDSKIIINFFDKFSNNLKKPTVVIMDQASIHTSDAVIDKLPQWKQNNLEIFWLPTYSPKLNLIEILWKFIKYEWIEIDAYNSLKSLKKYLTKVLDELGSKYVINFVYLLRQ
ncbi:MAG: IS630 family transposase [Xenococcaceae cyanobacterium MO_167.B52]|nr:IS630 family transposase [Xenococcaceae cyanobacterium MO_167.B52]